MDNQKPDQNINELFEKLFVQSAPNWMLERDPDGSYKYHATQSAFLLFELQQAEIDALKANAQAFHEIIKNIKAEIAQKSFLTMDADNENEVYAVNANEIKDYIERLIEPDEQGDTA